MNEMDMSNGDNQKMFRFKREMQFQVPNKIYENCTYIQNLNSWFVAGRNQQSKEKSENAAR